MNRANAIEATHQSQRTRRLRDCCGAYRACDQCSQRLAPVSSDHALAVVKRQQELAIAQFPTRQFIIVEGLDLAVALREHRRQSKQLVQICSMKSHRITKPLSVSRLDLSTGKSLRLVPKVVRICDCGTK